MLRLGVDAASARPYGFLMAKSKNTKKETKKAPAKTPKEKKLAKRAKKSGA